MREKLIFINFQIFSKNKMEAMRRENEKQRRSEAISRIITHQCSKLTFNFYCERFDSEIQFRMSIYDL